MAEGGAGEDEALDVFHRPTAANEFGGEPVEQFGMGGSEAHEAKVRRGGDDAGAEGVMPETVHHHACRQRIAFVRKPLGKGRAACFFRGIRCQIQRPQRSTKNAQSIRGHDFTRLQKVAPMQSMRGLRLFEPSGISQRRASESIELLCELGLLPAQGFHLSEFGLGNAGGDGKAQPAFAKTGIEPVL